MAETFDIVTVQDEDLDTLAALADEIWHQHFTPILGAEQVDYMVDLFQDKEAFVEQRANQGYVYCFIVPREGEGAGQPQGYMGYQFRPQADNGALFGGKRGELFLSKLYMRQSMRGRGGARVAFDHLVGCAAAAGLPCIRLTCNKHNANSLAVYDHLGFCVEDADLVADIGGGYVMDDYGMRYDVEQTEIG